MKVLTVTFGIALAGIVLCLGMSIYTGIRDHRAQVVETPTNVPTPAF